jgi:hypothetical protein
MATYGDMANRIADELGGRTELLSPSSGLSQSPIQLAILDAISNYEDERFYFNEYRTTSAFSTVAGQEFYTSSDWADIATIQHIDKLSVLISGNRFFMEPRTEQYLEDISMNASWRGQPVDYSYYNSRLRFYPIPDAAYPVNVLGTKKFTALSATGDTNVWTTEAEQLIRLTAKETLYRDTIQQPDKAAMMGEAADKQFTYLKGSTFKKVATLRFTPTSF